MSEVKLTSEGTYFGQPITLGCDMNCDKAWGGQNRPRVYLSMNEDDWAYLADHELDIAPMHPGTSEGDECKPRRPIWQHNKWCCRECERCEMVDRGKPIILHDFSKRLYNRKSSNAEGRLDFTVYWTKADDQGEFYVSALSQEEALKIAQWYIDLYEHTDGAEIKMIEGLATPVHGDVVEYAEG